MYAEWNQLVVFILRFGECFVYFEVHVLVCRLIFITYVCTLQHVGIVSNFAEGVDSIWIIVAICAGVVVLTIIMIVTRRGRRDARGHHRAVSKKATIEVVTDNPSYSPTSHVNAYTPGRHGSMTGSYTGWGDEDDDDVIDGLPVAG